MIYSRRTYNNRCRWWAIDKKNPQKQNIVVEKEASGTFFAKESQVTRRSDDIDSGILMIDKQLTTIETLDDVSEIDHKFIVEYLNQYWIVEDIQSRMINKTSEYYNRPMRIWYLTLRNSGK